MLTPLEVLENNFNSRDLSVAKLLLRSGATLESSPFSDYKHIFTLRHFETVYLTINVREESIDTHPPFTTF